MGFYTLILLAGLQAIPTDLYEAAEMDATPRWRVFWRITLPLLWPNLLVVIVLALIRAVQIFDEVFVLTGGGPGTATLIRAVHLRDRLREPVRNLGLAAAASIVLGVVLFVLTLAQLAVAQRKAHVRRHEHRQPPHRPPRRPSAGTGPTSSPMRTCCSASS